MSTSSSPTPDDAAWARVPEAARQHTAEGAEAFARFYLQQVNEAWMVPDPELIRPYALGSCKTCANFLATAVWLCDDHLRYDGRPTEVGASAWLPESTRDHVLVQIGNDQQRRRVLRVDGSVEDTLKAMPALDEVELRWKGDSWHVAAIRIVK